MSAAVKFINQFPDPKKGKFDKNEWLQDHGKASVLINCFSKDIYYPDHWTPLSMKCAFNGKEYYESGKLIQVASDESFLVFNEGKEYTSYIQSDTEVESFTVNFSAWHVQSILKGLKAKAVDNLNDPECNGKRESLYFTEKSYPYSKELKLRVLQLRRLAKEFSKNKGQITEHILLILHDLILIQSKNNLESNNISAFKKSTREELYKKLHMAKDHIDSSFHLDLSLDDLAKVSLLNPYYLLRMFKHYFKITPYQYLTQVRIVEASRLLQLKKLTVTDVSHRVGYSDLSSFGKLFKKITGQLPSSLMYTQEKDPS